MSRVFRRPMFRKGGPINDGIMTGIVDREQYANGFPGPGLDNPYLIPQQGTDTSQPMNLPDLKSMSEENRNLLLEAAGPRGGFDPLTTLLLQYGPQAAIETKGGSTLRNLIAAGEKPIANLIASKQKEDDFLRSIRTQATGAAIKQRSELEASERDRLFKKELADKQADLSRDLSNAEIINAKARADAKYLQDLELQSKKSQLDYDTRSKLLKEADELERGTTEDKIKEFTPIYAESYGDDGPDLTKGQRRATYEVTIRNQIAENFGESKVGGHIDVDVGNEKQLNKIMKSRIKAGGSQKIYYNVNDGKAYLLTEQGLQPVDLAGGAEQITEVTETTPGGETETIKETSSIEDIFSGAGETELDKKIKDRIAKNKEAIEEGQSTIKGPFR